MNMEVQEISYFLITSSVFLWLYWLWTRRHLYWFSLNFPGDWGLPFIGLIGKIRTPERVLPIIGKHFEKYKSYTLCAWIGLDANLLCGDPVMIEKILCHQQLLNKAETLYRSLYLTFGGGLIASPVHEWRPNRKAINPAFQHKVLLSFFSVFNKAKRVLLNNLSQLDDGNEHKIGEELVKLTIAITVETTLGKPLQKKEPIDVEFAKNFDHLLRHMTLQSIIAALKLDGIARMFPKFKKLRKGFVDYVELLVRQKLEKTRSNNNLLEDEVDTICSSDDSIKKQPLIFIDHAIHLYEKEQFTWNDMVSESVTLFAAASETSAMTLLSVLIMLAMHPNVQERLFNEIFEVFPEKDFDLEYDQLKDLPYLDMIVNETLRLAPAVPLIARQVVQDTKLTEDLTLPKGLQVVISMFHVHRRKDIWGPNADKFDPDHFLPENISKIHPYAYLPFSKGPRFCIGMRYALFSIKVIIAGLVRNFRFTTSFKYEDLHFVENISMRYLVEPGLQIHHRDI